MGQTDIIDLSESGRQARLLRRTRWLRIALPVLFLLMLASALFGILYFNHQANRRDALELSDSVIGSTSARIEAEVVGYLTPAKQMVELGTGKVSRYTSEAIRTGLQLDVGASSDEPGVPVVVDGPAPLALQTTGVEVLETIPQLAMVNIADIDGSFVMPKKMSDGVIDTKIIDRRGDAPTLRWIRRNAAGAVKQIEDVDYDGYDPRARPWYEGAVRNNGFYWTDIYILFTDRKPGVTAAHPMFGANGELLGVLGVDIELDALCSFLDGLKIGRTGRAVIVDDQGRVVAHPDIGKTMKQVDDTLSTVFVQELGDDAITRAYNQFRIDGPGTYSLQIEGVKYRGSGSSLPASLGTDWHVIITVPEEDYVGFVNERTRSTAAMSGAVLAVLAVFAGFIVYFSLRSDRRALSVLDRQTEFDRVAQAYLTLSNDTGLQDPDDTVALGRLTETAAEATGVMRVSVWQLQGNELTCLDAYDRIGQGHVAGTTLDLRHMPGFEAVLNGLELVSASDVDTEPRLSELDELYLGPLDHDSVVISPTTDAGRPTGMLLLEGSRRQTGWSNVTLSFVRSLSTLLGMRFDSGASTRMPAASPSSVVDASDAAKSPPSAEETPDEMRIGLDRSRVTTLDVQTTPGTAVLVILCTSRRAAIEIEADDPLSAAMLHEMACLADDWAQGRGGTLVSRSGDRIVIAAGLHNGPDDQTDQPIADLARLALDLQAVARLSDREDVIAVRMGIDFGEAGVARLGHNGQHRQIVGPAQRIATQMAECCSGDTIQVSDRAYQRLRGVFLLQRRGGFYAHGVGKIGLFFLSGELEESR